jgi:NADH-quinone oxidoreductase subunit L
MLTVLGLLTALMTAFYSFRLVFVTFWGESRVDPHHATHVHEPSKTMTVPLLILATLSILAGYIGIPEWLAPAFPGAESVGHHEGTAATGIMVAATAMGILGIAAAYFVYVKSPGLPDRLAAQWQSLYQLSLNKWFVDEAYDRTVVTPTLKMADSLWKRVDVAVIDGAVNGVARAVAWGGWVTRVLQSGQTQNYALAMTVGAVVILGVLIFY